MATSTGFLALKSVTSLTVRDSLVHPKESASISEYMEARLASANLPLCLVGDSERRVGGSPGGLPFDHKTLGRVLLSYHDNWEIN